MGSIYPIWRLVVVLMLVTVALAKHEATPTPDAPTSRWYIHVVNGLKDATLFLHCKSGDDDLGSQNVARGDKFWWTFRVNIWNSTLYWCFFGKPGASASFETFWVERKTPWLHERCLSGTCIWVAKDDGIYLKNLSKNVDELIHEWVPSRPKA